MNTETLCICLNSISSDSNRNDSLKQLINKVNDFTWDIVSRIAKCYSSDSYKVDAIKITLNSLHVVLFAKKIFA